MLDLVSKNKLEINFSEICICNLQSLSMDRSMIYDPYYRSMVYSFKPSQLRKLAKAQPTNRSTVGMLDYSLWYVSLDQDPITQPLT